MATIGGTITQRPDGGFLMVWGALSQAGSDVGQAIYVGNLCSLVVQAQGTNTNTVALEGSLDGTNWSPLGSGLTLTIGASGFSPITQVSVIPAFIRPATPSAGTNTVVRMSGAARA